MRAPELVAGWRVAAAPDALDSLASGGDTVLRVALDEALLVGDGAPPAVPGLVEDERGLAGWWLTPDELAAVVHHVEWALPTRRPGLAQGLVAGVPATLWLTDDRALLMCASAYAADLRHRLSEGES